MPSAACRLRASFWTQAAALTRKNASFQARKALHCRIAHPLVTRPPASLHHSPQAIHPPPGAPRRPCPCPDPQKRKWLSNAALLAAPFLICCLLWVMQEVINKQLDSRAFRCGCKCTSCCDWVSTAGSNSSSNSSGNGSPGSGSDIDSGGSIYTCYEATDERPCSPYAKCQVGAAPCSALPLQTALLPGLPHNFIVAVQHVP